MQNSPVDSTRKSIIKSQFVKALEVDGLFEVARFPIHLTDEMINDIISKDKKLWLYALENGGVNLFTHAGCKSFFVNIRPRSLLNPAYSKRVPIGMHRPNRRGSK